MMSYQFMHYPKKHCLHFFVCLCFLFETTGDFILIKDHDTPHRISQRLQAGLRR